MSCCLCCSYSISLSFRSLSLSCVYFFFPLRFSFVSFWLGPLKATGPRRSRLAAPGVALSARAWPIECQDGRQGGPLPGPRGAEEFLGIASSGSSYSCACQSPQLIAKGSAVSEASPLAMGTPLEALANHSCEGNFVGYFRPLELKSSLLPTAETIDRLGGRLCV